MEKCKLEARSQEEKGIPPEDWRRKVGGWGRKEQALPGCTQKARQRRASSNMGTSKTLGDEVKKTETGRCPCPQPAIPPYQRNPLSPAPRNRLSSVYATKPFLDALIINTILTRESREDYQ